MWLRQAWRQPLSADVLADMRNRNSERERTGKRRILASSLQYQLLCLRWSAGRIAGGNMALAIRRRPVVVCLISRGTLPSTVGRLCIAACCCAEKVFRNASSDAQRVEERHRMWVAALCSTFNMLLLSRRRNRRVRWEIKALPAAPKYKIRETCSRYVPLRPLDPVAEKLKFNSSTTAVSESLTFTNTALQHTPSERPVPLVMKPSSYRGGVALLSWTHEPFWEDNSAALRCIDRKMHHLSPVSVRDHGHNFRGTACLALARV